MQYGKVTRITEDMVEAIIQVLNEKFNTDKFKMVDNPFSVGNPFSATASVYISENNEETHEQTLMEIEYLPKKDLYYIRIGTEGYTRWSGGLEYIRCWFGGSLKTITKETFKQCFEKYFGYIALYKTIGCGKDLVEHMRLEDLQSYTEKNNLKLRIRNDKADRYLETTAFENINIMELCRSCLNSETHNYRLYVYNEYAV